MDSTRGACTLDVCSSLLSARRLPQSCCTPPLQIKFKVTSKGGAEASGMRRSLPWLWPYLLYYLASAAALGFFAWRAAAGAYSAKELLINLAAVLWTVLLCICIWPPLEAILPRQEAESGWRVVWRAREGGSAEEASARARRQRRTGGARGDGGGATRVFAGDDDDDQVVLQTAGYSIAADERGAQQVGRAAAACRVTCCCVLELLVGSGHCSSVIMPAWPGLLQGKTLSWCAHVLGS